MPEGKAPRLSAHEEADLDRILRDPRFQQFADDRMDGEFSGEGLCDSVPDLDADPAYTYAVRIALHNAAIRMLEPGEPVCPAYSIAREFVADAWQQSVLLDALKARYSDALLADDHRTAGRLWHVMADATYGILRRQFARTRAAKVG